MTNRGFAHASFLGCFWPAMLIHLTALGLMATSPRDKHTTPKCSDKQWDDASLLACCALKGFPCESVLKAKDLRSAWYGNVLWTKFPYEMASNPIWNFLVEAGFYSFLIRCIDFVPVLISYHESTESACVNVKMNWTAGNDSISIRSGRHFILDT